jgi:hypothetical protein
MALRAMPAGYPLPSVARRHMPLNPLQIQIFHFLINATFMLNFHKYQK